MVACLLLLLAYTSSARAAGEFEPNDLRDTAYGPLAGGTDYAGTFETVNDVDWFVFYIKTYSQMDFSASMVDVNCPYGNPDLDLWEKDGKYVDDVGVASVNETSHLYLTLNPGRYYFSINHYKCTGAHYRFRIDPATSITTSRECGEAIVAKDAITPLLVNTSSELTKTTGLLMTKAAVVHENKKELRQAGKKAQRLSRKAKRLTGRNSLRKLRRTRWKLRRARGEVVGAIEELNGAKAERKPVWEAKVSLEAVAGQQQQAIAAADGQIATYC